jgi:hypothetical protein
MRCKECHKKISLDHCAAMTRRGSKKESLRLVFKCACGFYVLPIDVVEIMGAKALVSVSTMRYQKSDGDGSRSGEKLSREGSKIFKEQGKEAYERWQREVYFPLMDAEVKGMKRNNFRRRAQGRGEV